MQPRPKANLPRGKNHHVITVSFTHGFIHLLICFIHSCSKYLMSTYYVPGTMMMMLWWAKPDPIPVLMELAFSSERMQTRVKLQLWEPLWRRRYSFDRASMTSTTALNNRNRFPHSPGGWKSKIKVWADLGLFEASLLGLRWPPSRGVLTCSPRCVCTSVSKFPLL